MNPFKIRRDMTKLQRTFLAKLNDQPRPLSAVIKEMQLKPWRLRRWLLNPLFRRRIAQIRQAGVYGRRVDVSFAADVAAAILADQIYRLRADRERKLDGLEPHAKVELGDVDLRLLASGLKAPNDAESRPRRPGGPGKVRPPLVDPVHPDVKDKAEQLLDQLQRLNAETPDA